MTAPRVDVPADCIDALADAHDAKVRSIAGIRWFTVTNPVTGAVVRIVGTHPSPAERARRDTAAFMEKTRTAAGLVPEQVRRGD